MYPLSLGFQLYQNYLLGRKTAPIYRCFMKTRPFYPSPKWQPACPDLSHMKQTATKTLYPNRQKGNCTLLLLSNFAQAEWLNVDCNKKLLSHVYCMHCKHDVKLHENTNTSLFCKNRYLEMNDQCFFLWWVPNLVAKNFISEKAFVTLQDISNFSTFLLQATSLSELSVLLPGKQSDSFVQKYTFLQINDILDIDSRKKELIPHLYSMGYLIHMSKKYLLELTPERNLHMFHCESGILISYLHVCDGHYDCLNDNSDELNCNCTFVAGSNNQTLLPTSCKHITLSHGSVKCGPLHFKIQDNCQLFVQKKDLQKLQSANTSIPVKYCLSGELIDANLWNDLVSDCFDQSDELELKSLVVNDTQVTCENPNQFPCKQGHSTCYNNTMVCVFLLDSNNKLYPCRNGGHLQRCKNYQCSSHFKCVKSYCIPWSAVCDGKRDCPVGEDESSKHICNNSNFCNMMFKCKVTSIKCIHINNVCDRVKDCPLMDDELLCDLQNIKCPKYCDCLAFAILCREKQKELFEHAYPYLSVTIYESFKVTFNRFCQMFNSAMIFNLQYNNMRDICTDRFPKHIMVINVNFNKLLALRKRCFASLYKLQILRLQHNSISLIQPHAFDHLLALQLLSLSSNPLKVFSQIFQSLLSFKVFLVKNISFSFVDRKALANVNETLIIITSDLYLCCVAHSPSHCSFEIAQYISCSKLLRESTIFPLISSLVLSLNIYSILVQITQAHNAISATVKCTNVSDIFLSIYLGLLSIFNFIYKDSFFTWQDMWRSSFPCFTAAFVVLSFVALSQALLLFLSLSRFMVVYQPTNPRFKNNNFTLKVLSLLFMLSLLVSGLIIICFALILHAIPSSLCLPFCDPQKSVLVVFVSAVIILSQFLVLTLILILHISLVYQRRMSRQRVEFASKQKFHSDTILIVHLFLMSFSNILCWFPTNIIYILAMVWKDYPSKLVTWSTVGTTPINSVMNPVLFVVFSVRGRVRKRHSPRIM